MQEFLHVLNAPLFYAQGPGLERRVIRNCIGYCGQISGFPKVPHLPQNMLSPPRRRPQPASHPSFNDNNVGDRVRTHITVPVVAAPNVLFHPPEEGLGHAHGFLHA